MPSASLVAETALLTRDGWATVGDLQGPLDIVGVDRFGKLVLSGVAIDDGPERIPIAYIGTRHAFGAFAAGTRLVCGDGRLAAIADIITNGAVQTIALEGASESAAESPVAPTTTCLWFALQAATALRGAGTVAFRCRTRGIGFPPWMERVGSGDADYSIISRRAFDDAINLDDWRSVLARTIETICYVEEEKRVELERTCHLLAAWYASALSRPADRRHVFAYDTIQHSCFVHVTREVATTTSSADRGATAFLSTETGKEVRISWGAEGWNPIAGGFILATGP